MSATTRRFGHMLMLLCLGAVVLRGAWVVAMACQHDADAVLHMSPDTSRYVAIADHLRGRTYDGPPLHDLGRPAYGTGAGAVAWSGPGYGAFVAGIMVLAGDSPWSVLTVQALLSAFNCVLVAVLAYVLLASRRVALIAGILAAVSLTSITLSGSILTETPMVTLFTASLLCFALGLQDGRWRWFIAAGVLVGLTCMVRQVVQFWPLVMVMIAVVVPAAGLGLARRRIVLRSAMAAALAVACMVGWVARNHALHGTSSLSGVGFISARFWLGARAIAALDPDTSTNDLRRQWLADEAALDGPRGVTLAEYQRRDRAAFLAIWREHPWPVTKRFIKNVLENMTVGDELHRAQLPGMQMLLAPVVGRFAGTMILGAVVLSAVGLLVHKPTRTAGIVLGATYAYLLGMSGFGCWQGSRYVFAAHMAWTIMIAWGLCIVVAAGQRLVVTARSRRTGSTSSAGPAATPQH